MRSFVKSFGYAFKGIAESSKGRNFRVQAAFAVAALIMAALLGASPVEWAVIFACIALVLGGECMNTALERLVDLVSPDYDRLAGQAKDCAAGAVLVASIASLAIAALIFLPKLASLLGFS